MIQFGGDASGKNNAHRGLVSADISDDVVKAAWLRCCEHHIQPSRLFSLAVDLEVPSPQETNHLESCERCQSVFAEYRCQEPANGSRGDDVRDSKSSGMVDDKENVRLDSPNGRYVQCQLPFAVQPAGTATAPIVPDLLRENLQISGPVIFPSSEVAFKTWQFGRLEHLSKANPELAESIARTIVDRAYSCLLPHSRHKTTAIVCFGRVLHRLGTRLATRLVEENQIHPHVILAHDFYSPALVCAPNELLHADVILMVDVMHTGGLLERLSNVCRKSSPERLRGLVVIDQSSGPLPIEDVISLWRDEPEDRIPIEQFQRTASDEQQHQLTRFEPNDECAVTSQAIVIPERQVLSHPELVDDSSPFFEMIQSAGALHCDYMIGKKRYPYVINVLDLLRDSNCREYVLSMATDRLAPLGGESACLVYHSGRTARAGKIAKMLGSHLRWPVVPLGKHGQSLSLTGIQHQRIMGCQNIVIVDAAIRTGDSLAAIVRSLSSTVGSKQRLTAFCVLNALSRLSKQDLADRLGIEIQTLFGVPLAPPTERVRHWISRQKAAIRDKLCESGMFSAIAPELQSYCEPVKRRGQHAPPSGDETKATLEKAISEATQSERASEYIERACKQDKVDLIRHLPLDQVVHDRSVQGLLLGVMYNSMKPSFKESAVFALGAARNYDWMTYEWLQCNRTFLGSPTNTWKSVLMIECQMKLDDRREELNRFREALDRIAARLPGVQPPAADRVNSQPLFSFASESESHEEIQRDAPTTRKKEHRLAQRVKLLIDVAQ